MLVRTTYVHVLHGRPSVTEPGNEGYRRIYPLKNFRRSARTTKILLHEKRTPENFTTRKFPDLRYSTTTITIDTDFSNKHNLRYTNANKNTLVLLTKLKSQMRTALLPHPQTSRVSENMFSSQEFGISPNFAIARQTATNATDRLV